MRKRNAWRWGLTNNRRKTTVGGDATSRQTAIDLGEKALKEHGMHGTVATITSPTGIVFTARPTVRGAGIIWERD